MCLRVTRLSGLLRAAIWSLPFLGMGYLANRGLFLSDEHARLLSNTLTVVDRGRAELLGFVYPPLPFFLLFPWPNMVALTVLSAMAGGYLGQLLWRHLRTLPMPPLARAALLVGALATPASLYVITESLTETLALLLLVTSWANYLAFVREGETKAGFTAGLSLGAALFVSQYALLYTAVYVLLTPRMAAGRGPGLGTSAGLVLIFPVAVSAGAWAYISWAFTGDPVYFLRSASPGLLAHAQPHAMDLSPGWRLAMQSTLGDLLASPLYLAIGLMLAALRPIRLLVFLVPALIITAVRMLGWAYPDHFAICTYTVTALIAMRPDMPRKLWPLLMAAAAIHVAVGLTAPMQGEMARWARAATSGVAGVGDQEEVTIGRHLGQMPRRSVLADDRIAYRLMARAGTAEPFLLPVDGLYRVAESQPSLFVPYILVPSKPVPGLDSRVAADFASRPPAGFEPRSSWSEWQLYQGEMRQGGASLWIGQR